MNLAQGPAPDDGVASPLTVQLQPVTDIDSVFVHPLSWQQGSYTSTQPGVVVITLAQMVYQFEGT